MLSNVVGEEGVVVVGGFVVVGVVGVGDGGNEGASGAIGAIGVKGGLGGEGRVGIEGGVGGVGVVGGTIGTMHITRFSPAQDVFFSLKVLSESVTQSAAASPPGSNNLI